MNPLDPVVIVVIVVSVAAIAVALAAIAVALALTQPKKTEPRLVRRPSPLDKEGGAPQESRGRGGQPLCFHGPVDDREVRPGRRPPEDGRGGRQAVTTDDAWDVAALDGRVPEAILPLLAAVRENRAKERVARTMRD